MANTLPMLMHSTYFKLLPSNAPDISEQFMFEALEYLSTSKGLISFWIGQRATDMDRPQNDLAYDLAMHQIFKDESFFDLYNNGGDPKHEKFVEDVNKLAPTTTRRVLDTYLTNLTIGGNASRAQCIGTDGNMPQSLFHSIYFSLVDKSPANIAKFTDICAKYLAPHPGIQQYCSGGLTDINRTGVSIRNFDVGVDIIYESKQAYDDYLKSELHDDFFPATDGMIDGTYIFDSYLKSQSKVYSLTR